LKIGRKTDKYEVAIVRPRMHNGHDKRTEAVIGDISTWVDVNVKCECEK